MFNNKPSGYWGAKRSILQAGKKNTDISIPAENARIILEVTDKLAWLFIVILLYINP